MWISFQKFGIRCRNADADSNALDLGIQSLGWRPALFETGEVMPLSRFSDISRLEGAGIVRVDNNNISSKIWLASAIYFASRYATTDGRVFDIFEM